MVHMFNVFLVIFIACDICCIVFGALLLYDVAFLVYRRRFRRSTWLTLLLGAGVIGLYVFALSTFARIREGAVSIAADSVSDAGLHSAAIAAGLHPYAVFFAVLLGLLGAWFTVTFLIFCIQTARNIRRTPARPFRDVVILGGGLIGRKPGRLLMNRLDKGVECLMRSAADDGNLHGAYPGDGSQLPAGARPSAVAERRVIVSGGQGSDEVISEAAAMREYLIERDVPEGRIFMEDRSRTTAENLRFSRALIAELDDKERLEPQGAVIVTNDFHALRTALLARRAGFADAQVVSCRTLAYYFPAAFIREFVGYQRVHGKAALSWAAVSVALSALSVAV